MFRSRKLQDLLHDYVAGDLEPAEARWIEARIAHEPKVRAQLEEIRETHDALTSLRRRPEPPLAPHDAWGAIREAIAADAWRKRPVLRLEGEGTRFYRRLAIAAMAVCAFSVGILVWNHGANAPATTTGSTVEPVASGAQPSAKERGLVPADYFLDAGRGNGLDGAEFLRMLDRAGYTSQPPSYRPSDTILPISADTTEMR